ncbi:MAG TPA: fused MFS/spermidine synthase [Polyangiaceae bacterium]|nr:fused MFS/spermidine synthase [Polyangiaceae bacterium]
MNRLAPKLALLLFGSGACALVYQVAWFREFRLVFGASTAATGAVLAFFVAGLGAGSLWLGRRADRHANPVRLYAALELGIALSAALTPALLWVTRRAYIALGGTPVLGLFGGTLLRLVLSALVLAVPTFLMGGTLPAVARAVQADDDVGRRRIGWLYGLNTLGAVTGSVAANFWLLETLGRDERCSRPAPSTSSSRAERGGSRGAPPKRDAPPTVASRAMRRHPRPKRRPASRTSRPERPRRGGT